MKDWRNIAILALGIILVYFILSDRSGAIDQVKLDSIENEKKLAIEKFFQLKKKTVSDSLTFIEHLKQDSINSLNTERLEISLSKARADYKEAIMRNKTVFTYEQRQIDSVLRVLYPNPD